jgi:hypothetical protein
VRVLPSARIRGRPRRDNFVELQWEDSLLFLEEVVDGPIPPMHAVGNMRIMVPNVDDVWTLAKKMGVQVIRPIGNRSYGLRDFTIAGPDGLGLRGQRNSPLEGRFEGFSHHHLWTQP